MTIWSLDLGSHNSAVARWNDSDKRPEMMHLDRISRQNTDRGDIDVKYAIPSAVLPQPGNGFASWFWRQPLLERAFLRGKHALIGRAALEADPTRRRPDLVTGFKPFMLRDRYRTLAHVDGKAVNARDAARLFLRELITEIREVTGERPRQLAIGTPVDSYEPYRAQLKQIGTSLGLNKIQFVDEPVAAALGYGISAGHRKPILVIDFGAGTLDLALISMAAKDVSDGACTVLAKAGAAVGGNHIDSWMLEHFCEKKAFRLDPEGDPNAQWWYRTMLDEARSVKERLFFEESSFFYTEPPESMHQFEALLRAQGTDLRDPLAISREDLIDILTRKGLYNLINERVDTLLDQAGQRGVSRDAVSEVLMVGGSTLLPGVYPLLEKRFGRDRVRAWQPFHAVAYGAAAFASGNFDQSDFITHDYAIRVYHPETHETQHQIVVPRGTNFPTATDFWKRRFTPTCALGEPEKTFKLVICELGSKQQLEQEFAWDPDGRLHNLKEDADGTRLIIPLNDQNPALGFLDPPHSPGERAARLEISFGVNEDRWLVASVFDLKTRKKLMDDEAVIRIL